MRSAAFLDRDGTLIRDERFLADASLMRLLDGAVDAVRRINEAGILAIVATNQSGIGRGLITPEQYESTRQRLDELVQSGGAHLDAQYHCPHAPGVDRPCDCRKPLTGMFLRAAAAFDIDLRRSLYVGDRRRDVQPALTLGGYGVLVPSRETPQDELEWGQHESDAAESHDADGVIHARIMPKLGDAVDRFLIWLKSTE